MTETENAPEKEPDHRKTARERAERWEREIQDSGHAYAPTEETKLRRNSEMIRDRDENEHTED